MRLFLSDPSNGQRIGSWPKPLASSSIQRGDAHSAAWGGTSTVGLASGKVSG
jgi:hypothetical protein